MYYVVNYYCDWKKMWKFKECVVGNLNFIGEEFKIDESCFLFFTYIRGCKIVLKYYKDYKDFKDL